MNEPTQKKPPRQKSSIEIELYAARRVGEVLKGLSLEARQRVLGLVAQHNAEERQKSYAVQHDPRQTTMFPAAVPTNGVAPTL